MAQEILSSLGCTWGTSHPLHRYVYIGVFWSSWFFVSETVADAQVRRRHVDIRKFESPEHSPRATAIPDSDPSASVLTWRQRTAHPYACNDQCFQCGRCWWDVRSDSPFTRVGRTGVWVHATKLLLDLTHAVHGWCKNCAAIFMKLCMACVCTALPTACKWFTSTPHVASLHGQIIRCDVTPSSFFVHLVANVNACMHVCTCHTHGN